LSPGLSAQRQGLSRVPPARPLPLQAIPSPPARPPSAACGFAGGVCETRQLGPGPPRACSGSSSSGCPANRRETQTTAAENR
jgi:hypothetical protein